jgi:hypothetical protein
LTAFLGKRNAYLMAMVLFPMLSFGQLYYTVGTGTTFNSTYSYPCPYGNYYDGLREQYLYTASELNAAGFAAGSITEIAFDVQATNSVASFTNYTVYIWTTTATSITSFQTLPPTPVYQATYTVSSTGWNAIPFTSPFIWNGQDNILIQVCYENSCSSWTTNASVYYSTSTFSSTVYRYQDCTAGMCGNTSALTSTYRPNTRFTVIPPVANDAGVATIVSPGTGNCTLGSLPVKVVLNNLGSDTLTSCTVNWSVQGTVKTPFNFSGTINPNGGVSDTITIGTATFFDGDTLLVYTTNPNNVPDSFPNNDSLLKAVFEALGGTYTIGGTTPDYATIMDAVNDLKDRGVCSDVVMEIRQGTYNQKIKVPAIPGTSATNTVTFTADPANTAIVEITATPDMTDNYVLKLSSATYVNFEKVTMTAINATSYGVVLEVNNSKYCNVMNCVMNGVGTTSSGANLAPINGVGSMNITISDNEVNDGSYSINWNGGENISLLRNDFLDAYYYGIYLSAVKMLKLNNNDLRSQGGYLYGYGLYVYNIDGASQIIGNNINWPGYMGMYLYQMNGKASAPQTVANNMVRAGNGSSYAYAIYLYNSGFVNFVNNTIAKDVPTGNGYYAMYVTGGANRIMNNIFYYPNGSSSYYNFYFSGAFAVSECDYNNVYTKQSWGYLNAVHTTLTAWQNATGHDLHSTKINPVFISLDSMRHCNDSLDGTGTPLSFIIDDIDGDGRNPVTPDVGADEWIGSKPGSYSAGDDAIVCEGKSAVIGLPVTGGSFTWSTADSTATIVVSSAGTYTVTMTSACGAQHSDTVVVVDVTPVAIFSVEESFQSGKFVNTSVNGNSYMWVINTNPADTFYTTDLTHVFPDNGPYDVTLYVMNDCDTVSTTHTWEGWVGVEENSLDRMISLFPNPASEMLTLSFKGLDGDVRLELTNIQGQFVYGENFVSLSGNSSRTIDVSNLNKGVYMLRFITADAVSTKQVIVQ